MNREKKKIGRPLKITDEVLKKLEYAFSLGCSDNEACIYADITPATLYNYQKRYPDFVDRKNMLKDKPILKARTAIDKALTSDDEKERNITARWLLEHKKSDEFNTKQSVDVQTSGSLSIEERSNALDGFLKRFDID